MPIHDWTRVGAGIFHHFHQRWIGALTDVLNDVLLPTEYYALAEQQGGGFESDVLTLKASGLADGDGDLEQPGGGSGKDEEGRNGPQSGGVMVAEPPIRLTATTDLDFYRRKQNVVAVRHASGDHLVAIIEILSKGNESGATRIRRLRAQSSRSLVSPGSSGDHRPSAADTS